MITNDNTNRAIQALKQPNRDLFYGDLDDYLIECLESLKLPLTESELIMLHTEMLWIAKNLPLKDQVKAIDECFSAYDVYVDKPNEEEPLNKKDNKVGGYIISVVYFSLFFSFLVGLITIIGA